MVLIKYFKLTRSDGVYWQTNKILNLLAELGMTSIERQLRNCYDSKEKVKFGEYYWYLERFKVDNDTNVTFGKFGEDEKVIKRDFSTVSETLPVDEYELEREELIQYSINLKKKLQRTQDTLRIERKALRFENRASQHVENLLEDLIDSVPKCKIQPNKYEVYNSNKSGVIQLSDLHIGERVDLANNEYDFETAKKRLNMFFNEVITEFKLKSITNVSILLTGDLINLDTHMDKKITNEACRSEAMTKAFEMLSACIELLLKEGFNLSMASVVGNESRLDGYEKFSSINSIAMNNFDYLLYFLIKTRYSNSITFLNNGDTLEDMVNINGKNIILVHGDKLNHNNLIDSIIKLKLRWFEKTGIMADYCLLGHIHQDKIETIYARSGSLVGANGYSDNGLNIPNSRASQNIGIIDENIKMFAIPVK